MGRLQERRARFRAQAGEGLRGGGKQATGKTYVEEEMDAWDDGKGGG